MEIFASTGQEIRNLLLKKVDGKRKTLTLLNQWDKISEENGATLQSDNIICLGDLNCDGNPLDNYNKGRCLLDVCDIYDLDLLNSLDPEDVYWAWEKLFIEVLDEHTPVKSF